MQPYALEFLSKQAIKKPQKILLWISKAHKTCQEFFTQELSHRQKRNFSRKLRLTACSTGIQSQKKKLEARKKIFCKAITHRRTTHKFGWIRPQYRQVITTAMHQTRSWPSIFCRQTRALYIGLNVHAAVSIPRMWNQCFLCTSEISHACMKSASK